MDEIKSKSIALTITSPPYWDAIDYDIHTKNKKDYHRRREYSVLGRTYEEYLENISLVFMEILNKTMSGGFCAIVVGTVLKNGLHYPLPMHLVSRLTSAGWQFHQDIIWHKVTGGVKRAGSYIQHPYAGYFYPNIMTEYILVFRKHGTPRRDNEIAINPKEEVFKKDIANNIWHIAPVPPKTIEHPCPYPAELVRRLLLLYSQKEDLILDPFVGSGTTILEALKYKRKAVGYEIESAYIELTRQYIEKAPPRETI